MQNCSFAKVLKDSNIFYDLHRRKRLFSFFVFFSIENDNNETTSNHKE